MFADNADPVTTDTLRKLGGEWCRPEEMFTFRTPHGVIRVTPTGYSTWLVGGTFDVSEVGQLVSALRFFGCVGLVY